MNEGKLAVMFPGQGKLQPGMGEEAFRNSAEARAVFEEASIVAKADMAQVCFGDRTDELPKHPQMSLAAASLADYEYKIERELPYADLYMGMSAGEMAALAAAGAFESRQSFFTAVLAREEAMVKAGETHPGRMVAVRGITKEQGKRLAQKVKASYAGRVALDHINISGDLHIHERIEQALDWLKETEIIKRIVTIPLPETVPPAHGDLQQSAVKSFQEVLQLLSIYHRIRAPYYPFLSNTSELINDTDELISYLVKQLTNDIDIPDQLDKAKELGITSFAEVGPGNSMTKIVQRHFEGAVILQKRFGTVVHINGIS